MVEQRYIVSGMTCAACQANIERVVKKLDGVISASVSLVAASMLVVFDETKTNTEKIVSAVEKIGYGAKPVDENDNKKTQKTSKNTEKTLKNDEKSSNNGKGRFFEVQSMQKKECHELKVRLISSIILLVPLFYFSMFTMMGAPNLPIFSGAENSLIYALFLCVLTTAILIINKRLIVNGLKALFHLVPNMDSLVSIGALASYIYGIVVCFILAYGLGHQELLLVHKYMHSLYFEGSATILTLVTLGKFFELRSRLKTSGALEKLAKLAPQTAKIVRDGEEVEVNIDQINVGDIVVIKTGDTIPCDGTIIEGEGYLNQSAITGESVPVKLEVGGKVISAGICTNGSFLFKAERVGEDTTLAKVINLVDSASGSKAPIARIADKVSGVFVPVVLCIALLAFVLWAAIAKDIGFALEFAVAVLVISCPCALGLATPVAIMVAMGKSASLGILIKSAESLETLHKVSTIVFDKTGTLTEGKMSVTDILPLEENLKNEELIKKLAILEKNSEHPLAQAVIESAKTLGVDFAGKVTDFQEVSGKGVRGRVKSSELLAGNFSFIADRGLDEQTKSKVMEHIEGFAAEGKTAIVVVEDSRVLGLVAVADAVRQESKNIVATLKNLKIRVIMLTGDNGSVAKSIAKGLGIDSCISNVLPEDKYNKIEELKRSGEIVAMVGDGINDSPALAASDVSIAMGSGTDIAAESSDIVLSSGSLSGVVKAIELSRATIRNIKVNLFWAFFYNILAIPLAAGVFYPLFAIQLSPMIASLAMSCSSVFVVLNALTLNLFKPKMVFDDNKKPQNMVKKDENLSNNSEKKEKYMQKTIYISGMSCAHCKANVERALTGVEGVKSAEVNLEGKFAIVEMKASVTEVSLIAAVEEAGYKVTDIK